MIRRWIWPIAAACLMVVVVASGCGCQNASDTPKRGTLLDKTELFDRRYSYLLRGDEDFPTLTSRYKMRTGIGDDDMAHLELVPDPELPVDGSDSCAIFKITLKKVADVMAVVADSIGSGLVAFDFGKLPAGEYTLGNGAFPPEMTRWINQCRRLVISLVIGDSIRHRARWSVTEHDRLVHRLDF